MSTPPSCPMMNRGPGPLAALAVLILLAQTAPTVAQTPDAPHVPSEEEGRVLLTLYASTSPHGHPPTLTYSLVLNVTVEGDTQQRHARAPLPENTHLRGFMVYLDPRYEQPETETVSDKNGTWAVAQWNHTGPVPGTQLAMRLDAQQEIDPEEPMRVEWTRLPANLTSVRLLLPHTHTPVVPIHFEIQREDSLQGRIHWNLTNPPGERLELTIHPIGPRQDPGLAAPPPAWSAYAVLAGLLVLSTGIWFIGKKIETRQNHRDDEPDATGTQSDEDDTTDVDTTAAPDTDEPDLTGDPGPRTP